MHFVDTTITSKTEVNDVVELTVYLLLAFEELIDGAASPGLGRRAHSPNEQGEGEQGEGGLHCGG